MGSEDKELSEWCRLRNREQELVTDFVAFSKAKTEKLENLIRVLHEALSDILEDTNGGMPMDPDYRQHGRIAIEFSMQELPPNKDEDIKVFEALMSGKLVDCSMCGRKTLASTAHLHNGEHIGNLCCWDDSMKST